MGKGAVALRERRMLPKKEHSAVQTVECSLLLWYNISATKSTP